MTKWQFVAHFAFSEHKKTDARHAKGGGICLNGYICGKITFGKALFPIRLYKKPCIYIIKYDGNSYDYCRLCQIVQDIFHNKG